MSKKLTTKEIKERICSIEGNKYELLSEYVGANTKIKIKHVACGHEYEVRWDNFQQGRRCPKCTGGINYTNEEIVQKMYELVGEEYTKLDDTYINCKTKFPIRHELCGHEYEVSWDHFQKGNRCPKCNQSKGEKEVAEYLTNHNISFATQVRFDDCRHKKSLPFDFGIVDNDKKIIALIEYDGEQHFEPVKAWGGEEKLKLTQLRDSIKNDYCKENDIPLLRIKHNEDIADQLGLFFITLNS